MPSPSSSIAGTIYERAVLVDTSGLIALHAERRGDAVECMREIQRQRLPLYVTSAVIAETHRRLLHGWGRTAAAEFLSFAYSGEMNVVRVSPDDEANAVRLIGKYADQDFTLCDALSFAVMLRLGILKAFTYDLAHFRVVGFVTVPPI